MALYRTDWAVASYPSMDAQSLTIDGLAQVVPAGSYYLYDAINDLSLLAKVEAAMAAAGVAAPKAELLVNRKVRLSSSGAFAVNWGAATTLRDMLGYSLNLVASSSYIAPRISPLLWSPGTPGKSLMTRKGMIGHPTHLTYQSVSSYTGRTESVNHGIRLYNSFEWTYIDTDRIMTSAGATGEYATWVTQVAATASRFKLYHDVQESTDTTPADTLTIPLGPYIYSADRKGVSWLYDRSRGYENLDIGADIKMNVHVCPEYEY